MADIFLSYAREDRARAAQVAQGLQANGFDVFWDTEIPPGVTWADHIESKLSQCKALIVLWTGESVKSQWVREEARMGRDKGVLIPVMLDTVPAPLGFGELQAADLSSWNGEAEHPQWGHVLNALRARMSVPAAAPVMGAPARAAPKQKAPVWAWAAVSALGVIAALIVIGLFAQGQQPVQPQPQPQPVAAMQPAQPQPSAGQPDYRAQILERLQQVEQAFAAQGFARVGEPNVGQLRQGQSFNVPATLETGTEYRIIGVCDNDCGDLDLVLYDQSSNMISQDTLVDAAPVVSVAPQWTGPFTVQARMHQCTVEPCYYALVLYGRAPAR